MKKSEMLREIALGKRRMNEILPDDVQARCQIRKRVKGGEDKTEELQIIRFI